MFHQFTYIFTYLSPYNSILMRAVFNLHHIEHIGYLTIGPHNAADSRYFAVLPEVVYHQVMRNTHYPLNEFAFGVVLFLLKGTNNLKKGLLENIFSNFSIAYNVKNISENAFFITL